MTGIWKSTQQIPNFYKWTQWIFVKMFKAGLAYEKEMPINWCPSCKTGLANEEVVNGCCERCGTEVTKKNLKQWMLKITAYADRSARMTLISLTGRKRLRRCRLTGSDRSYGAEVDFKVDGTDEKITVYTTRPDTLTRCNLYGTGSGTCNGKRTGNR